MSEDEDPNPQLRSLESLGIPSLQQVQRLAIAPGQSQRFEVDGQEWFGQVQPLQSLQSLRWRDLNILMAIPTRELLSGVEENLQHQAWLAAASILFMVILGAVAGRRVGQSLSILAAQAEALARFDFRRFPRPRSHVREMRDLGQVMDDMSETIAKFLDITHHISAEVRLDLMLSSVLYELVQTTHCRSGAVYLVAQDGSGLERIARYCQEWQRHFDHRLGLSAAELDRLGTSGTGALPATEQLLADRPDHIIPWGARRPPVEPGDPANRWGFNMVLPAHAAHLGELHNLSVRRGTLTEEDRFKINEHIVQTIIMLSSLPFPPHLARVPDIAGTHHEKMDGTGYPRGLAAAQLTLADRVMALADIFEALTAADRPYKPAKTLSESLAIMAAMARQQHIDAEVFRFFLRSSVWRDYAERFLSPLQRDAVDVGALEASLG